MHIVIDYQIFCIQQYGGISRYFSEIAHYISLNPNHEIKIFAPFHINKYLSFSEKDFVHGINIPHVSWLSDIFIEAFDSALSFFQSKSFNNIDIYHETYFSLIDSCPSTAKRIVTVYDMIHELSPQNHTKWNRTLIAKRHAVKRADHIICISRNTQQDLVELLSVPEEKTSVVYMGNSLLDYKSNKNFSTNTPFLLYVGTREKHKNFLSLCKVFACSPIINNNFSLICFGGGPFTTSEKTFLKELGISSKKILQISGDDQILADLYQSASALVYPSLYEGFGIPPLEAMSMDCPVICSNTSSLPEVVGDAAEFFDPSNEDNIRSAIETVITSKDRSSDLVLKGRKQSKKFSWQKCANETLLVYQKVLQS